AMPNLKQRIGVFDTLGFIFFGGALTVLTLGLEAGGMGTMKPMYTVLLFVVSCLLIVLYVFHAKRTNKPLIDLKLFKIRTLRVGLIGSLATRLGIGGLPLLLPLMLQVGFGYSAAIAGMILIPSAIANLLAKPLVVRVVKKFGYKKILLSNTLILAFVIALFALPNADTPIYYLVP